MPKLADEAAAQRELLGSNVITRADVVDWADRVIRESDDPDPIVCEIAVSGSARDFQILEMLSDLARDSDRRVALGLFLRGLGEAVDRDVVSVENAARWISTHAIEYEDLLAERWPSAIAFSEELYLAKERGMRGIRNEIEQGVVRFLREASSFLVDAV